MKKSSVFSIALVIVFLVSMLASLKPSQYVYATPDWGGCWYYKTDMPTARWAMAAVELDGMIYVIGGRYGEPRYTIMERYNPATDSWATMAPMPTPRAWLVTEAVNGKIYAIGGSNEGGKLNVVEEYDPLTDTWATKAPMTYARDDAVAGVVNNKIYVMGGWNGTALDYVEEYDPSFNSWTIKASMPYTVAMGSSAAVNDKIYVMGGQNGIEPLQDAYEYDPSTDSWTKKTSMGLARTRLAAAMVGDVIYVVGGHNPTLGLLDTVQAYYPTTDTWATLNAMPTGRADLTAAAAGGMVYVFGGHSRWDSAIVADTHAADFSCGNSPPDVPTDPDPGNGWTNRPRDVSVSWTASDPDGDPITYDVYFGEAAPDPATTTPPLVSGGQTGTTYDPPGTLKPNTAYYWTVIATDSNDAVTAGPRWAFETGPGPYIEVEKTANPPIVAEPGGPVAFTIEVTNAATDTVSLLTLVDDPYGDLDDEGSCSLPQTLAADDVYTCTFTADVTGAAGDIVTDTVTATAENGTGEEAVAEGNVGVEITDVAPTIIVSKAAEPESLPEPGGTFTFTVEVSNTSSETLTLESLVDDVYGDLDAQGDCSLPQSIDAANSYSCAFSADISGNAGLRHTDTVTATAKDDEENIAEGSDSATVELTDVMPSITLLKTADPTSLPESGGTVTFTTVITNTSVETITLQALVDDVYGDLDGQGDCNLPQTLNPDVGYSCAFTGTVSGNGGVAHTDTVTATIFDDEDNFVYVSASATVEIGDVTPVISVTYTADPTSVKSGETVTFTVLVDNESIEPITLISLDDTVFGDVSSDCDLPAPITVGGSFECMFDRIIGIDHASTITATVEDDDGSQGTASADVQVDVTEYRLFLPLVAFNHDSSLTALQRGGGVAGSVQGVLGDVLGVVLAGLRTGVAVSAGFR